MAKMNRASGHQRRRDQERRLVPVLVADPRQEGHRDRRAEVDREVEPHERVGPEDAVPGPLLVVRLPEQGRDVRLDDPAAHRQQGQGEEDRVLVGKPDQELADHVRDREPDDRPVLPEEPVGEEAAQQGQEVAGGLEVRVRGPGDGVRQAELGGQVQEQDGPHPVVAGPLGELAPEHEQQGRRVPLGGIEPGVLGQNLDLVTGDGVIGGAQDLLLRPTENSGRVEKHCFGGEILPSGLSRGKRRLSQTRFRTDSMLSI